MTWWEQETTIRSCSGRLLESVRIVDLVETGPFLATDTKAVTVRLTYRAADRTLNGSEVDEQVTALKIAMMKVLNSDPGKETVWFGGG